MVHVHRVWANNGRSRWPGRSLFGMLVPKRSFCVLPGSGNIGVRVSSDIAKKLPGAALLGSDCANRQKKNGPRDVVSTCVRLVGADMYEMYETVCNEWAPPWRRDCFCTCMDVSMSLSGVPKGVMWGFPSLWLEASVFDEDDDNISCWFPKLHSRSLQHSWCCHTLPCSAVLTWPEFYLNHNQRLVTCCSC